MIVGGTITAEGMTIAGEGVITAGGVMTVGGLIVLLRGVTAMEIRWFHLVIMVGMRLMMVGLKRWV